MKIKEIILLSNNLIELKEFYHQILGFPIISTTEEALSLKCGHSKLTFIKENNVIEPYYHFAFNISENKLNFAVDYLKQQGIVIYQINGSDIFHSNRWNSDSTYFYDPAGNIVEFIARHRLSGNTGHDFTINDVINISEIGIPSDYVDEVSEFIQKRLKETVYLSGNSVFTPIGDEEGLFILSALDRNWLGSDKKVEVFPLQVIIESDSEGISNFLNLPYSIITK